ncbi:MAG TPA: PadR family transcriptional regulator [Candidatus Limnocylindrales bacterium]|nr:PadR family transcriptional regulator [Candidatus Limnocylindrales bacterium]
MSEAYRKEIVQHIIRNMLDIQLLRIVRLKPTWGYSIKKRVEAEFDVKLRHGALYPALNALEARGFVRSRVQEKSGRFRKVYAITDDGDAYLQAYYSILRSQFNDKNV